ncbi:hypothetical protein ACHAWF_000941 [Thalassiosira exigua]
MAACNLGCMMLYVHSVLWGVDIPQEAAKLLYENNDACTAINNAQTPTTHMRHIDIKISPLVDTLINLLDHFTKALLPCNLFYRHFDYTLGDVPPRYVPSYDPALGKLTTNAPLSISLLDMYTTGHNL